MSIEFFNERIQQAIDVDVERCKAHGWRVVERSEGGHTIGDFYAAVLGIDNADEARRFFDGYVAWMEALPEDQRDPKRTATDVARINIGWVFGEGMPEERQQMWADAVNATHPVFGAGMPTPEGAFLAGKIAGGHRN